jgi:hypothetical protein
MLWLVLLSPRLRIYLNSALSLSLAAPMSGSRVVATLAVVVRVAVVDIEKLAAA